MTIAHQLSSPALTMALLEHIKGCAIEKLTSDPENEELEDRIENLHGEICKVVPGDQLEIVDSPANALFMMLGEYEAYADERATRLRDGLDVVIVESMLAGVECIITKLVEAIPSWSVNEGPSSGEPVTAHTH